MASGAYISVDCVVVGKMSSQWVRRAWTKTWTTLERNRIANRTKKNLSVLDLMKTTVNCRQFGYCKHMHIYTDTNDQRPTPNTHKSKNNALTQLCVHYFITLTFWLYNIYVDAHLHCVSHGLHRPTAAAHSVGPAAQRTYKTMVGWFGFQKCFQRLIKRQYHPSKSELRAQLLPKCQWRDAAGGLLANAKQWANSFGSGDVVYLCSANVMHIFIGPAFETVDGGPPSSPCS